MYYVGKKSQMDIIYRRKKVKEEMQWIMPMVLETKGTLTVISANMRDTEQYLAIPIPPTWFFKKSCNLLLV